MIKIRLQRIGRKHVAYYNIVVVEDRSKRDGKVIEKVGTYNPLLEKYEVKIEKEKVLKWLHRGAVPSSTVRSFLSKAGILLEKFLDIGVFKEKRTEEYKNEKMEEWKRLNEKKVKNYNIIIL